MTIYKMLNFLPNFINDNKRRLFYHNFLFFTHYTREADHCSLYHLFSRSSYSIYLENNLVKKCVSPPNYSATTNISTLKYCGNDKSLILWLHVCIIWITATTLLVPP